MTKLIIAVLLIAMIASLGVGLYHLLSAPKAGESSDSLYKSLRLRIGIWVVLFAFLLLALKMEWIKPSNSVHPANFNAEQQKRIEKAESEN
ncbi:MAG: DUF2909 family protein [Arenicella sp.]|jgi:hypothetical protein|nr:DUF2909 family protein [Arenicella sp.]